MDRKEELKQRREREEKLLKAFCDREKMLMKEEKQLERKERTRRLIERGAMVEKYLVSPLILSNEQVAEILLFAFSDQRVREVVEKKVAEAKERILGEKNSGGEDEREHSQEAFRNL